MVERVSSSRWAVTTLQRCALSILAAALTVALTPPGFAHQVQVGETVGGTLHLEPNDTPRAQEETLIWLALTRRGGQTVPLEDCNCFLSIYQAGSDQMLAQPYLQPISAEGYEGIPAATFTFPAVGAYTLVFEGEPQNEAEFAPFELIYTVTVAAAAPPVAEPIPDPIPDPTIGQVETPNPPAVAPSATTLGLVIAAATGVTLWLWSKLRS